jgi:hypothetical protein
MNAPTSYRFLAGAIVATLMTSAVIAGAQFGSLSGPIMGYVFDRNAGRLRPLQGIPGSATVGKPVESPPFVQALGLDATHVIASSDSSRELVVLSLGGSEASSLVIPGAPSNPSRSAASNRGTAAAFYYSDTHQIQAVTGLPNEPRTVSVHQLDGPVTQMAINDDATLLLFAVSQEEGEALYSWNPSSGSAGFVTSALSISAISITRNGDAIVTDRGADEVFAIWNPAGGAVRRLLADKAQGVSSPAGVVVSDDRMYVGNAGSGSVMTLDSNGRFLRNQSCGCTISGVFPLRDSLFRLTDRVDQTTFLLDASTAEARILFVPPAQE